MLRRLTAEDERILELESGSVVGHTCKVVIAERVHDDTVGALRRLVVERVAREPRLGQRLVPTPLHLARPAWVDDPAFDPAAHVVPVAADGPVDRQRLREIVAELMAQRLDRDRPLWRLDVVEPLADDHVAVIWRIHHALADGQASRDLGAALLWEESANAPPPPLSNTALLDRPALPGSFALLTTALAERAQELAAGAVRTAAALASRTRWRAAEQQLALAPGTLRRELHRVEVESPLDAPVGRTRRVAFVDCALDDVHGIARSAGATINDVLLALVAGGLRRWLEHRHGDATRLRVQVPVSLHRPGDAAANRDSFFNVDLPADEPDAGRRLHEIAEQTRSRKTHHDAEELFALFTDLAHLSKGLYRLAYRAASDPHVFALAISNVRGPDGPRYLAGGRIREFYPLAEIAPRHALRVNAWSFSGRLSLGLCADAAAVPDLDVVAAGVERSLDELVAHV